MEVTTNDPRLGDAELERLLRRVYVDGGYTPVDVADRSFAAAAVRARGEILVARDGDAVLGMVIVVPHTSPARRIGEPDEVEMQLLAVHPDHRGRGVGARLVDAALEAARPLGARRMVLWTQPTMTAAQRLYASAGFVRAPQRDAGIAALTGRTFLVYERWIRP